MLPAATIELNGVRRTRATRVASFAGRFAKLAFRLKRSPQDPQSGLKHSQSPVCMGRPYADGEELSLPPRGRKVAQAPTDGLIADRLAALFRGRAVKALARVAQTCEGAVKKWRAGHSVPSGSALIRLIHSDDDVFAAVLELAGRSPTSLTAEQRKAVADALKILEGI